MMIQRFSGGNVPLIHFKHVFSSLTTLFAGFLGNEKTNYISKELPYGAPEVSKHSSKNSNVLPFFILK